jgi:hypothetical protein
MLRGGGPSAEVLRALGIAEGEMVIAAGMALDGTPDQQVHVVATTRGLYCSTWTDAIAWEHISSVQWDEPVLDLVVVSDADAPAKLRSLRLARGRKLPEAVHDRVRNSVVTSERREVAPDHWATFAARRSSTNDAISWTVVFDRSSDLSDPVLRQHADAILQELRQSFGI